MDIEEIKSKIKPMAEKYGLKLVVLFGSRARGDSREKSDFDIAYLPKESVNFSEENHMAGELYFILKSSDVDLVNLSNASPLLFKKIFEESVVLYEIEKSLFNNLYLYAARVNRDSEILHRLRRDYVRERINQYKKDVAYSG
ncbi:MAG: nucleotidyltransferase domain-containing protein [Patescibacteria group bacterium]